MKCLPKPSELSKGLATQATLSQLPTIRNLRCRNPPIAVGIAVPIRTVEK